MPIPFNQIQADIRVPGVQVEIDGSRALAGSLPNLPLKVLIIASKLTSGSAEPAELYRVLDTQSHKALFGTGSQASAMINAFKRLAPLAELWVTTLEDDDTATGAHRNITFDVPGTTVDRAGNTHIAIGGTRFSLPVQIGDESEDFALRLANLVATDPDNEFAVGARYIPTFGGTATNGDYVTTFTGFGLDAPVAVTTTRAAGTPATNTDLAVEHAADILALAETTLASVIFPTAIGDGSTTQTATFYLRGGLPTGVISHSAPAPGTLTGAFGDRAKVFAKHLSAFGSDMPTRVDYFDGDVSTTQVTVTVGATTAGTVNPDIADIISVLPEDGFTHIITGWNDAPNLNALTDEVERRWGPTIMQGAHVFTGRRSSESSAVTAIGAFNSPYLSFMYCGELTQSTPQVWAAQVCGRDATEPNPVRQRRHLTLPDILPTTRSTRSTYAERDALLRAGAATHDVTTDGTVFIERLQTTYKTDLNGNPDPTFRDRETLSTIFALGYTARTSLQTSFPRPLLQDDSDLPPPGLVIVSPKIIRAHLLSLYDDWVLQGWVEPSAKAQFAADMRVERNASDRSRIDIVIAPNITNNAYVFAVQIQFTL